MSKKAEVWGIMMYKIGMIFNPDDTVPVYAEIRVVKNKSGQPSLLDKELTDKKAWELIEEYGLELAVENEYGKIWHDPKNTIKDHLMQMISVQVLD